MIEDVNFEEAVLICTHHQWHVQDYGLLHRKNGLDLDATVDDAEEYVLAMAGEQHLPVEDSAGWLADHTRPF